MIYRVDPNASDSLLFDPLRDQFSALAWKRLQEEWPGVFRHVVLELMPVDAVAEHFNPVIGRPTKELYSMSGLILPMEFFNWSAEQAADAYMFGSDVAFALNLPSWGRSLSDRTVERYQKIFREDELAAQVMEDVTGRLCEILGQILAAQRLDSTHVFSNMAQFGRTRMMGVTVKRFRDQVIQHDPEGYAALPEALRTRYTPSDHRIFADCGKEEESRKRLRQDVAEDMYFLITRFQDDPRHQSRKAFQTLARVFEEQCEVG